MKYNKPHKEPSEIISILQSRNLIVKNKQFAIHHLTYTGHFRLSGYSLPFQKDTINHIFKDNVTFEQIVELYNFDRKLRLLLLDALERIEVGFRTAINIEMSNEYGNDWLFNKKCYAKKYVQDSSFGFDKQCELIKNKVDKSRDVFIVAYKDKYNSPKTPPSWMLIEIMDFGNWSIIYKNLTSYNRKLIEKHFRIPHKVFSSWIESLAYIRNLSAHHSRVWNRTLTKKPKIPKDNPIFDDNTKIYSITMVINHLLSIIEPSNNWQSRLDSLIEEYPVVDTNKMGFIEVTAKTV